MILCNFCTLYVVSKNKESSFCLIRDLFTHTEETVCENYQKGTPITEEEYDSFNYAEVIDEQD